MAVVGTGRASGALAAGGTSGPNGHDPTLLTATAAPPLPLPRMIPPAAPAPPATVPQSPPAGAPQAAPFVPAVPSTQETQTFVLPLRTLVRLVPVQTERHLEFVDVTDEVARTVTEAGLREGFAVVFSRHTTAGVRINEHEPLLLEDMACLLERVVPVGDYRHDDFTVRTVNLNDNERVNGHSHCRSLLLGASETVPISGGCLLLGRWQRIFLVELDGPARRELIVQVVGG
jgi:secondary thiamine-phosphate synthase enzyme